MNPNNPYQQNNYDFIMNPNGNAKRPLGGNSDSKKLLIIVGAVILFIIVLFSVGAMLTGNKSDGTVQQLTRIAQEQGEIAHISSLAGENGSAQAQSLKNFAYNANLTMTSDQQAVVDLLAKNGTSVKPEVLAALQDPAVDQKLTDATAASDFDAVFKDTVSTMLTNYQSSLQSTYATSKSTTVKQLLQTDFNNAELLKKQLTQQEF